MLVGPLEYWSAHGDESRRQKVYRARFREARLIANGVQFIVQFGNWEDAMKVSSPFAHYHDLLPL
jgi:hypothetical protein